LDGPSDGGYATAVSPPLPGTGAVGVRVILSVSTDHSFTRAAYDRIQKRAICRDSSLRSVDVSLSNEEAQRSGPPSEYYRRIGMHCACRCLLQREDRRRVN
jgi:hypothetical protein